MTNVNDAPVATADEDTPATSSLPGIFGAREAGKGTVVIGADGTTLIYTPNPDVNGSDRFS